MVSNLNCSFHNCSAARSRIRIQLESGSKEVESGSKMGITALELYDGSTSNRPNLRIIGVSHHISLLVIVYPC